MSTNSISKEIRQLSVTRPHVVVLGAGASRAALPDGDRHGRKVPLMADFVDIVPVGQVVDRSGLPTPVTDFEAVYSELRSDPNLHGYADEMEAIVVDYFSGLQLPDRPTIYDLLLLSLREKDVVATFNWDPFLLQAAMRQRRRDRLPTLLFLHGNVLAGFCPVDGSYGIRRNRCDQCGGSYAETPLLFSVLEKNYEAHPAIADYWHAFKAALRSAFMLTVFGYGAPASDKAAMGYIREGWGPGASRNLEQFEAINTTPEEELRERWKDLIHTHHYEIHPHFEESWVANHPRRSGEAWWNQYMEAAFIEPNPPPRDGGFDDLWEWFDELIQVEDRAG